MHRLLVPLFLLAAALVGCGETSDEESTPTSVEDVAEVHEGLRLVAPLPSTSKPGTGDSGSGLPDGFDQDTGSDNPGNPGDDRMEPVPVPWDTPRVKSAKDS